VSRGALSILLHAHMPYVEGFGTWPFGEEWLWEAIATSYLPLLDVLDAAPNRVTLSVTPVLADQLEAPGALERCRTFLREVRAETHRRDIAAHGGAVADALERSAARYAAAADALERRGDLLRAFAPHVSWTSTATHATLPLLATDAGVRLQLQAGIAAHRARFGGWEGGLWLPECAYEPWLAELLEEQGVHALCVDLSDVLDHRDPLRTAEGPRLVPLDRAAMDLVWSDEGYPSRAPYRDSHALTDYRHQAWAIGGAPYDEARALARARDDAADFVRRVKARGGLCVCAFDAELFGHFWHEGPAWLAAVIEHGETAGLDLVGLDEVLADARPIPAPDALPATSWGAGRDLRTWSGPAAGGLAWRQRAAELRALTAAEAPGERALRELLALQSSDWAFLIAHGTAGDYPRERFEGHWRAFEEALAGRGEPRMRNLAPYLPAGIDR
jgi:1,4-alpha-glucan branching enzyme